MVEGKRKVRRSKKFPRKQRHGKKAVSKLARESGDKTINGD